MKHTKEAIEKIRRSKLGRHHTEEEKKKIRLGMLRHSAKITAGLLPVFHHSKKSIARMRIAQRKWRAERKKSQ